VLTRSRSTDYELTARARTASRRGVLQPTTFYDRKPTLQALAAARDVTERKRWSGIAAAKAAAESASRTKSDFLASMVTRSERR